MKLYDAEFASELLVQLRKRQILERANWVNGVSLAYYIDSRVDEIDRTFQKEWRQNGLLQNTAPEAWLSVILLTDISQIRPNVQIPDRALSGAIQRYIRKHAPTAKPHTDDDSERLVNTVEPFLPAVRSLLWELCERGKSLFSILAVRPNSGKVRATVGIARPKSQLEKIMLDCIRKGLTNPQIATALDHAGIKPRSSKSYTYMLHADSETFQARKSQVARKYLVRPNRDKALK